MKNNDFDRRAVISGGLSMAAALGFVKSLVASPALADDATATPPPNAPVTAKPRTSTADKVLERARQLAKQSFSKPTIEVPAPFDKLSYDQYRDIRFSAARAIWRSQTLNFEIQPLAMGWLYDTPVDIFIVEDGAETKLLANSDAFTFGPLLGKVPPGAPFGFSGFRVHTPINRADYFDEFLVFQGASYFRAVGRNETYGASARGLAINTARPGGEEFPFFRSFWIERPSARAETIVVHALLDSPSITGAYTFTVEPGNTTQMLVEATLFPRKTIQHVGIAPLTSMFLHGPASPSRELDFRPEVHDSEGLAIWNGKGELIWRPLANPRTLQVSAFMDKDPRGFGLWQRGRHFYDFEDLEAHYQDRPSVWVEPLASWGEGYIELIEIPVQEEIHDNIVAYWKPAKGIETTAPVNLSYRLHWSNDVPVTWSGARVAKTRLAAAKKPKAYLFVIDYNGATLKDMHNLPTANVSANPGEISNIVVQRNPEIDGIRVAFEMDPGGSDSVELRMSLKAGDETISETMLYRWTKP